MLLLVLCCSLCCWCSLHGACSPSKPPIPPYAPALPCPSLPTEWWEALVPIPSDAAVLNFVVNYFEHFDNNDRKDFKVGGCCLMKCGGACCSDCTRQRFWWQSRLVRNCQLGSICAGR